MFDVPEMEPKKLNDLQEEVYSSIDFAKSKIDDIELFETLNTLSDTWDMLKDEFLLMSVALISLKDREKEEIEQFLKVVRENGVE
jgi:hypothetical protein